MESPVSADTPTPAEFNPADYRILVVDDDLDMLSLIQVTLGHDGYRVEVAERGGEGLARLESEPFDLVIVDTYMPDMLGIELLRRVRAEARWAGLRVIVFGAGRADHQRALDAGADGWIDNPTSHAHLEAAVRRALLGERTQPG